ncbi:hypothetical protein GCM10011309_12610 [Litorimonas cladophorae]|uniref:Uncharacterized protein n=1 Tax=Litorimonas cladophorae TaxID=1220491 RepID=A0A918KIJ7_9PROT|nr:hypothetical protein [Litorimonas cladophorae]GGX64037.1 hypothetical protein GCM10011309_12610 [Litorimonas cladophorae]
MVRILSLLASLPVVITLSTCGEDSEISYAGSQEPLAPKLVEGPPPLSPQVYDFAVAGTQLFFLEGRKGIESRFHPALQGVSDNKWSFLEGVASDGANLREITYSDHAYGEHDGMRFVVIELKVPYEGGHNLVKMVVPQDEPCCRLVGIDVKSYEILPPTSHSGMTRSGQNRRLPN